MKDRLPLYPGRVIMTPVPGQANTFDMVRADEPQEVGTPLNKANLFSDETASLFDLTGDEAVPDRALKQLAQTVNNVADLHVWIDSSGDYLISPNRDGYSDETYTYLGQLGSKTPHMITGSAATKFAGGRLSVNLGGRPKLVFLYSASNNNKNIAVMGNSASTSQIPAVLSDAYVSTSNDYHGITDTGFEYGMQMDAYTIYYVAIM